MRSVAMLATASTLLPPTYVSIATLLIDAAIQILPTTLFSPDL